MRSAETGAVLLKRVRWCSSFWCRFRGLQLRAPLPPDEGLLIAFGGASIAGSSIHMFFMRFAIAAVWLDGEFRVVGAALAKPWRPYYAAGAPAQYVLEAMPALLERVKVGDRVVFE
ncbi:MAG: DUF192 domain-containing protein [Anaerolineae bacterium]|nr:DUF192 domain-containing protein [Anaerolineae bacterium]